MEGVNIEKKNTPFIPMYFEVNFLNEKCTKEFYKTSKFYWYSPNYNIKMEQRITTGTNSVHTRMFPKMFYDN